MMRKPPPSMLEQAAGDFIRSRRGRPAAKPPPSAARAVERVLRPLARQFGVGVEQLREHWTEIVGERLAKWSEPETIQRGGGGVSTLVIRARGAAAAILQAETRRILERVRTFAGDRAPTRLRILQGQARRPAPGPDDQADVKPMKSPSQVNEGVEQTPEARLLSALNRFEKSVRTREGS
ncbi:DUF721 domain-containing protein [Maricaulis sp.]|uniref:DUF721 domain-containing protein n=1 Tax=Maricaulis sp. TaxID=1486257 RepID=UPI0025C0563D|nr:DUF721 domain-containing protein [Maricaulis sp.]